MKQKRMLAFLLACCACLLALSGCGVFSSGKTKTNTASENEAKDLTSEHPVQPYAGIYTEAQTGFGSAEVFTKDEDEAEIVVRWVISDKEMVVWNMSGKLREKSKTVRYNDCVKSLQSTDESGKSVSKTVYTNGKGEIKFTQEGLSWIDQEEHFADDAVFLSVE